MNTKKWLLAFNLLTAFFLLTHTVCAQKHNNNWYFGNGAGLNFNTSPPSPVVNGNLYTEEGCASISDANGNLLFYTNGIKVWDKKHEVMQNGIGLAGGISSTQSSAIVQAPKNKEHYYIFTVDEKAGSHGFSYSIVDMTKRHGKGNVVVKNQFITGPVSEKLLVAPHANGTDYWIIIHKWNSDAFYAYQLTTNGLETKKPVISKIGSRHQDPQTHKNGQSIGQMKLSPNFKKLAVAICYQENNNLDLFDFDINTGKISNYQPIPTSGFAYGVEFSPNSQFLYVSFLKGNVGLIQYDLSVEDPFDYSIKLANTSKTSTFGALQLGSDNKIYLAKTGNTIDIISDPNKYGLNCKYTLNGVNLNGKYCVYGLPALVYQQTGEPLTTGTNQIISAYETDKKEGFTLCSGEIELDAGTENLVYLWNTGETSQKITVTKTGTYTVKISQPDNIKSQSVSYRVNRGVPKIDLGKDTVLICKTKFTLDAKNKGYDYLWSNKKTTQTIDVNITGRYAVTVTNGECSTRDTVLVEFRSYPPKFKCLTSFNPKNASFNSEFDYSINDVDYFHLEIKNPKGKTVFKTSDTSKKWDGKTKKGEYSSKGNYEWLVKYSGPCTDNEIVEKTGIVKIY